MYTKDLKAQTNVNIPKQACGGAIKESFLSACKQALLAALEHMAQSRGEWKLALPSRAQKCFLPVNNTAIHAGHLQV